MTAPQPARDSAAFDDLFVLRCDRKFRTQRSSPVPLQSGNDLRRNVANGLKCLEVLRLCGGGFRIADKRAEDLSQIQPASASQSRGRVAIPGNKPAEAAARKQQGFLPIIGVGFDGAQEDDVVAAVIPIGRTALEIGNAIGQHRRVA